MNIKKYLFLVCFSSSHLLSAGGTDPNVVNTTGGILRSDQLSIDFSIGETFTNTIGNYTFGFLQPTFNRILAVENIATEESFKIFPNPAADIISIRTSEGNNRIAIFTFSGQKIMDINSSGSEINIKDLAKGPYYIFITDANGNITNKIKFVKN